MNIFLCYYEDHDESVTEKNEKQMKPNLGIYDRDINVNTFNAQTAQFKESLQVQQSGRPNIS